jgi:hypothetical protein
LWWPKGRKDKNDRSIGAYVSRVPAAQDKHSTPREHATNIKRRDIEEERKEGCGGRVGKGRKH